MQYKHRKPEYAGIGGRHGMISPKRYRVERVNGLHHKGRVQGLGEGGGEQGECREQWQLMNTQSVQQENASLLIRMLKPVAQQSRTAS